MALRCLIVDNSAVFLDAARVVLEHGGIAVVGIAATPAEALRQVGDCRPDAVLVDIDLGTDSGFDLARQLDERARTTPSPGPVPRIVMISNHAEEDFADLIAEGPAVGFLAKSRLSAEAVRCLLSQASGPPGR